MTERTGGDNVPETQPTPWELMRILRDIREDLRDMKRTSITRDEWTLAQQSTDRRFTETTQRMVEWREASTAEHVELHARIDAVNKDVREVRGERAADEKEKRKDRSGRYFAIALAGLAAVFAFVGSVLESGLFG